MQAPPTTSPIQTLYCRNLDDRIHPNDLKANLYEFFIAHGEVISVNVRRTKTLRGQAFVSFRDVSSALSAFHKLQGKIFLGRPITIDFAKSRSDAAALLDGTYRPRKKQKNEMVEEAT